jgi:dolichol-phosphate mannosyltransferase
MEEILFWCRQAGCRMGETPILFENRRSGQSKINKSEALKALQIILHLGIDRALGRTR